MNYDIDTLTRSAVIDQDGDKIGGVGQVFLDDATGQPTWVTVNTGLFGAKETFIPLRDAQITGEEIRVPYAKGFVKDAPNLDIDDHLSPEAEQELYRYYSLEYGTDRDYVDTDRTVVDRDRTVDVDRDRHLTERDGDSLVAHEERLNVGVEQRETGRVRLRKHVVTETQQVEVPIKREELHVERENLNERVTDHRIGEDTADEVIVLHEERPVVSKETVATERVNVGTETVQENRTVQADVQKEQIEVDQERVDVDRDRTLRDGDLRDGDRGGFFDRDGDGDKNILDRDEDGKIRDDLNPLDKDHR